MTQQASRQLVRDVLFDAAAEAKETSFEEAHIAGPASDYVTRNRDAWERLAPAHMSAGRRAWATDELRWGLWETRESKLRLLDGFHPGEDAIELGSGPASISAWLARRGLRPVAVDVSKTQLATAQTLQAEFDLRFPLVCANAEQVAFEDSSFDLAISEYGASLWCDPSRWISEVSRLLRPEGKLIFVTSSTLLMTCTPEGGAAGDRLVRDHFARRFIEFGQDGPVEFHLTHGEWIRLLRQNGFVVDGLIEVRPEPDASPRFDFVSLAWARSWPSEDVWIAHKTG